ncbi:MAG: Gfo/Idh/MocA family protein [Mycobacteriales bacterium]
MRVGIVGLGVISRYYLAALTGPAAPPDLRLAAVCDLDPGVLDPHRDRLACFTDHRTLLASGAVDAVVVNVPNDAHHPIVGDVLTAGLPVCVEKPLATRLEQGEELVALARRRGLPLLTAFHRRYNDNVLALRRRIGRRPVRRLTVRYHERIEEHVGRDRWYLDPDRCGGGCVADNGPNAIDLVHLLLGPVTLDRAEVVRDAGGVDRQATLRLRAASGATARVELDWSYPYGEAKDVRVELVGGDCDGADMLAGHPGFKSSLRHEYVGVLRHFADILHGRVASWPDGLEPLRLVTEVYRSERGVLADGPAGGGG